MSFSRYPEYKDSEVEWLGQVPAHWTVVAFRRVVTIAEGQVDPRHSELAALPLIAPNHIEGGTGRLLRLESAGDQGAESGKYEVRKGDVVYSKIRPRLRKVCIAPTDALCSADMYPLRPQDGLHGGFLYWWLLSEPFSAFAELESDRVAMPKINRDSLNTACIPLPSTSEQKRIAEFLDRETAKIDALVAEQERLIALLKEKRQAVISNAVTKGLNPDVPMKDSGVEWIGQVPRNWSVVPLRSVAQLESGHTPSRQRPEWWVDCTIPWFSLADVWQIREGKADVVFETAEKVSELGIANSSARLLPTGTVILSRTASVGFSAIMGIPMATTQDFANWICGPRLSPQFLLHVLRAMAPEFERLKMGSTHNTIYMPDISAFRCPLPLLGTQHEVVAALKSRTDEIDQLLAETEHALKLLSERRSSIITAVVTGQIDVRGFASVEAA
ncbi:MAG: restriction endonuclease subunit S [Gemmatimonas sp.]